MKFPLKIFLLFISYNISLCVMKPNKTCIKPNPVKYANYNYTEAKPYSYLISNFTLNTSITFFIASSLILLLHPYNILT